MKTTDISDHDAVPLMLHIRRLRQWYGEQELSQEELAELAGVSTRTLHRYENYRVLPQPLAVMLAVSLALEVPITALIDPRLVSAISSQIEARRHRSEPPTRREASPLV